MLLGCTVNCLSFFFPWWPSRRKFSFVKDGAACIDSAECIVQSNCRSICRIECFILLPLVTESALENKAQVLRTVCASLLQCDKDLGSEGAIQCSQLPRTLWFNYQHILLREWVSMFSSSPFSLLNNDPCLHAMPMTTVITWPLPLRMELSNSGIWGSWRTSGQSIPRPSRRALTRWIRATCALEYSQAEQAVPQCWCPCLGVTNLSLLPFLHVGQELDIWYEWDVFGHCRFQHSVSVLRIFFPIFSPRNCTGMSYVLLLHLVLDGRDDL